MDEFLGQYLSVPLDLAQAREFNLFDWARNKLAYERGLLSDPGPPPRYFLNGRVVSSADITRHREMALRHWEEIQGKPE